MDRVFVSVGDGAGARKRQGVAPGPRQGRTWWEVMHPEGSEGTWRDLPRLLGDGTRRYDVAGGSMRKLQNLGRRCPNAATNLRFRTT